MVLPMPELPEVEQIRKTLSNHILGMVVGGVRVRRSDVIQVPVTRRARSIALLRDGRIDAIHRHGKRLAFEVQDGRILEFGLGMTGQFVLEQPSSRPDASKHRHVTWQLKSPDGSPGARLSWQDPRRFGGITPVESIKLLRQQYWSKHGPDALKILPDELHQRLSRTQRAVKTALLDQKILAGVGNIYADEGLHEAGLLPARPSNRLTPDEVRRLHVALQRILAQAVRDGGSTIRDHQSPLGCPGSYQARHAVYGRSNEPCTHCGSSIQTATLGGRTTNWCPECQT